MLDIIVNVDKADEASPLVRGAIDLAGRDRAFITGLQIVPVSPALIGVPEASALLDMEQTYAMARREWWLGLCKKAGVIGDWEVIRGMYVTSLAKRSQLADFVISRIAETVPGIEASSNELTQVLFAGASPMLLVPSTWINTLRTQCAVIAWNGSSEAARSTKAALPLLKQAVEVHVLDGVRDGLPGISPPAPPLRTWLAHHGINAQWHAFADRAETGRHMQDIARGLHADLLVMGAWGRTRLSEFVLGGATRWLLNHTEQPLFLAR
jgi:nucleotide-binding universal stress UspA family protein